MTITKQELKKFTDPVPVTEMTTSVADHKRNTMQLIPVEERLLYLILDELKIHTELLKKRQ